MHGYQIITELTERSDGDWRPSAGSVYPTLQQLADEGLVRDQEIDGRRVYQLTDTGRAVVERDKAETPPWERPGGDEVSDIRRAIAQVAAASMQVVQDGDPARYAEARRILADCRRSLYRLLAEADAGGSEATPAS
jgi:DNA-binding PadR family transcriptional regulator